jgi:glycosyltransferase involved in cell wall biosynthesis
MQAATAFPEAANRRSFVPPRLFGLTQSSFDPASRFRFIQFIPYFEKAGWKVDHRPNRPDRQWKSPSQSRLGQALSYRRARFVMRINRLKDLLDSRTSDVVFVNRDFAGEGPVFQKVFRPMVEKAVFDFDDAIFIGKREHNVRWMCKQAQWVTPGNEYLANYARKYTDRVTVIPTVIDTNSFQPRVYGQSASGYGPVRVGWSGSDQSIGATLVPNLRMLRELQKRVDFELVVISNSKPELPVSDLRWSFRSWRESDESQMGSFFDIGIMPLVDDAFQKGKCALKLLQYMAAGLPTVASPVGVNTDVVQPGITGLLASTDAEWHRSLEWLIKDAQAREAMGMEGRKRCQAEYSIHRWLPVLLGILETVRNEQCQINSKG